MCVVQRVRCAEDAVTVAVVDAIVIVDAALLESAKIHAYAVDLRCPLSRLNLLMQAYTTYLSKPFKGRTF